MKAPKVVYGILDPKGCLQLYTLSETRKGSIDRITTQLHAWSDYKQFGWKCVKIDSSKLKVIK